MIHRILFPLGFLLATTCSFAQFDKKVPAPTEQGWNPDTTFPQLTPAEAMMTIEVPKGYRLECVASEQRQALQAWLTKLIDAMHGRIHGFNVSVANVWAEQEHLLEKAGLRMPVEDGYIAATPRRHGLTIVAGNDKDFRRPRLKVFNPFKETDPTE